MAWIFGETWRTLAFADILERMTQQIAHNGSDEFSRFANVGLNSHQAYRQGGDGGGAIARGQYNIYYFATGTLGTTPSGDTFIFGGWCRHTASFADQLLGTNSSAGATESKFISVCDSAGTVQFWVRVNSTGTITVYRGSTALGTTVNALSVGTLHFIEIKVKLSTTVGTVDVNVDNVSWLSLTGQNTQAAGTATWQQFIMGPHACINSSTVLTTNFKEWAPWYICDGTGSQNNDFLGPISDDVILPNAAGTISDWTRSTGSDQWATIDETLANGDTDYNSTATANNRDSLNYPNAPSPSANVYAVQVCAQVRKTDAGIAGIKLGTRISGSYYDSAELSIPGTYIVRIGVWELNPATGVAWVSTDIDSAEFGYLKST